MGPFLVHIWFFFTFFSCFLACWWSTSQSRHQQNLLWTASNSAHLNIIDNIQKAFLHSTAPGQQHRSLVDSACHSSRPAPALTIPTLCICLTCSTPTPHWQSVWLLKPQTQRDLLPDRVASGRAFQHCGCGFSCGLWPCLFSTCFCWNTPVPSVENETRFYLILCCTWVPFRALTLLNSPLLSSPSIPFFPTQICGFTYCSMNCKSYHYLAPEMT